MGWQELGADSQAGEAFLLGWVMMPGWVLLLVLVLEPGEETATTWALWGQRAELGQGPRGAEGGSFQRGWVPAMRRIPQRDARRQKWAKAPRWKPVGQVPEGGK